MWEELRRRETGLAGSFAFAAERFNLNPTGEVDYVDGLWVSGEFFRTLGIKPYVGRVIEPDDDQRGRGGQGAVAVLSYAFWQQRYGANRRALGETIRIEGQPFQIVGVTPPCFFGVSVGQRFDIAIPLASEAIVNHENSRLNKRTVWWLNAMARRPNSASVIQTEARLNFRPQSWKPQHRVTVNTETYLSTVSSASN
jgi:putative ABC transport system permease protein